MCGQSSLEKKILWQTWDCFAEYQV